MKTFTEFDPQYFTKNTLKIALDAIRKEFFKKYKNPNQKERNIWKLANSLVNGLSDDWRNTRCDFERVNSAIKEVARCHDLLY